MKINSIIDLVKDLDTSRQTKNLNKLLIRILLHLQVEFSSLDDRAFPDFLLKKGEDEKFYLEVMKIAKDLNLIIFVLWYTFPENECDWGDKLIWIETPIGCYKTETADFF